VDRSGAIKRLFSKEGKHPRVAQDEFFHIPRHRGGHPRGILRRGNGQPAAGADTAALPRGPPTPPPLVGSRSLDALVHIAEGSGLARLRSKSPSLMFDATAAHADEEDEASPADNTTLPPSSSSAAPWWMRALTPELVPLRPRERQFVLKRRAVIVLDHWIGSVSNVSMMQRLLELCGNDITAMTAHNAFVSSFLNLPEIFLSPIICALSDQYGRVPFMSTAPLGLALFWLAQTRITTTTQRFLVYMLTRGVMRAGVGDVRESAFNDLFASQPETYAVLKASDGNYQSRSPSLRSRSALTL
jgi:hypothetical protein